MGQGDQASLAREVEVEDLQSPSLVKVEGVGDHKDPSLVEEVEEVALMDLLLGGEEEVGVVRVGIPCWGAEEVVGEEVVEEELLVWRSWMMMEMEALCQSWDPCMTVAAPSPPAPSEPLCPASWEGGHPLCDSWQVDPWRKPVAA